MLAIFKNGLRSVVIVLMYVEDILNSGDKPLAGGEADALMERFPTKEGGDDDSSLQFADDTANGLVFVGQEACATKLATRHGFGSAHTVTTPPPIDFTAASNALPPGATPATVETLGMAKANGDLGFFATHTIPHLLYSTHPASFRQCYDRRRRCRTRHDSLISPQ